MFGMEKGKKKASIAQDYTYDLENELKDGVKMRQFKEKSDGRVQELKTVLSQGVDKQQYKEAQALLYGYMAMQKVIQRLNRK